MKRGDRIRQGVFTLIFGYFVFYTIVYIDFNPYPKWLSEKARKMWLASGLDEHCLQDGDLVLRHSKGFVSDAILTFQTQDPQYSHSGIVRVINDSAYVYHSTGGEENVSQKMKRDPLAIYCHPQAVYKFAVFRWDLPDDQLKKFVEVMDGWYRAELEFDLDFDMTTNDKMYCSEMIYKAMVIATNDTNFIPLSKVIDKPYVAIDNLYLNGHCTKIFNYEYE